MKHRAVQLFCLALCACLFLATATVAQADSAKITLTMLDHATPENAESGNTEAQLYRKAVDLWLKNNPNVELKEESISHEVYETKIKTLAAANELPDIFMALPTYMKSFYDNGQIIDLRPIIEADAEWNDRYVAGSLGDYEYGDVILGAPRIAIYNSLILWNKAIFAECGYDSFPKTAEEFKDCVAALKEHGYIPMACGNKGQYAISSQNMPGILFKFCSKDWYQKIRNHEDASFTDEAPVAAITYLDELMKLGLFNEDVNSLEQSQARQLYYSGKAAMAAEGSWIIGNFINETTQDVLDKTEITVFPVTEAHPEYAGQIVGGQGWGLSLNANLTGEKLAAAADFLKTFTDPSIQAFAVEGGMVGIAKDIPYDASKLHPFYQKFLNSVSAYDTVVGCPEVQLSAEYMDASYVGYQELSIGAVTPEELAQSLQAAHEGS